jgi:diguanylate cyclase (GGDEF)-like protein
VDSQRRDRALWLERVPSLRSATVAGAALSVLAMLYAALAVQDGGWLGAAQTALGAVSLAFIFLATTRVGSAVALAAVVGFFVLRASAGALSDGLGAADVFLPILLLGSFLAGSHLRLSMGRRDAELGLAAEALAELTREDRITEQLAGHLHLTWLEAEVARARRHHHQLSFVLIRPDGFEDFAAEGPEAAESALEAVAEVIGSELRSIDIAVRHDGTTFALLLPETAPQGARIAAERIRLLLPARTRNAAPRALTVSAGIACFPRDASTDRELVTVAERALEAAVERGGNRTVTASADEPDVPEGWTLVAPRSLE